MRMTRREATVGGLSLLGTASVSTVSRAEWSELNIGEGLEDFWLATDAYIYGYKLVTMEMTRRVMTNVATPQETRAPMGQFVRAREYPNASYRDVTAPNADTLYTIAWINVGAEPWVLSIPDMKDRYFLFPMLDGWTTVFQVPGKRTTGTGGADIRHYRAGMERHSPGRHQGIQIPHKPRLDFGSDLLHGHTRGLQGCPRSAGPMQGGAVERLRQAIHAT